MQNRVDFAVAIRKKTNRKARSEQRREITGKNMGRGRRPRNMKPVVFPSKKMGRPPGPRSDVRSAAAASRPTTRTTQKAPPVQVNTAPARTTTTRRVTEAPPPKTNDVCGPQQEPVETSEGHPGKDGQGGLEEKNRKTQVLTATTRETREKTLTQRRPAGNQGTEQKKGPTARIVDNVENGTKTHQPPKPAEQTERDTATKGNPKQANKKMAQTVADSEITSNRFEPDQEEEERALQWDAEP